MPLMPGNSSKTISENIRELHTGKTFSHTAAKFGKGRANKQAVAIALSEARKGRAMGGMVGPQMTPPMAGMPPQVPPPPMQGVAGTVPPPAGGIGAGMPQNASMGLAPSMPQPSMPLAQPVSAPLAAKRGGALNRAFGGMNMGITKAPNMTPNWQEKQEARNLTRGPILSNVPGRTDAHATHVPSGSYVVPADIVSGRGQGNTLAGVQSLQKLFKMGPYGSAPAGLRPGRRPAFGAMKTPKAFASGGGKQDGHVGKPVRVNLAGGEIVIPPEHLLETFRHLYPKEHYTLKQIHTIMDAWVLHERKHLRKTLAKLPGPARD
jgi:hypothetical protein